MKEQIVVFSIRLITCSKNCKKFLLVPTRGFVLGKKSQGNHFGNGGLKARANLLVGSGGNLVLKYKAKKYLLGVKGGNFIVWILALILSLKVLAA